MPGAPTSFLRANALWLAVGATMTFASSFGQTSFISVFAGEFRSAFGLSHAAWGIIYSLGTLGSAVLMALVGPALDRFTVRALALAALAGLALFCLGTALAGAAWLLPGLVLGLRFFGQGMLTQLPAVAMGRWFHRNRGRAVSIAFLGIAAGEATLPLAFVVLTGVVGWRGAWAVAAVVPLLLAPVIALALRRERVPGGTGGHGGASPGLFGRHWTRSEALGHWLFWVTFPAFIVQPLAGTALFFQIVHLADVKGFPLAAVAGLIPVLTAAGVAGMLAAGLAVDRFGVGRVVPFMLAPASLGYLLVAAGETLASIAAGFALVGASSGILATVSGTYWPAFYGTGHLGAIRSLATAVMVFATALGPAITGSLIDLGVGFSAQLAGMAVCSIAGCAVFWLAMRLAVPGLAVASSPR